VIFFLQLCEQFEKVLETVAVEIMYFVYTVEMLISVEFYSEKLVL